MRHNGFEDVGGRGSGDKGQRPGLNSNKPLEKVERRILGEDKKTELVLRSDKEGDLQGGG